MYSIPQFKEFADILHDRFHAILYHIEEIQDKFTLVTNLIDRSGDSSDEKDEVLLYAGTDTQRKILEGYTNYYGRRKERDKYWEFLGKSQITNPNSETFRVLTRFRRGELSLKDMRPGFFEIYFQEDLNPIRQSEKIIFDDYFNLKKDGFLSIPVIAFGTIDGIVHIISSAKEIINLSKKRTIKRIIKILTTEYESLLLDWDVAFENRTRASKIKYNRLKYDKKHIITNPIMAECGFLKYYKISDAYHKKVIGINDETTMEIMNQFRQNAIISILIDSFAHNISTHSLTALSWWFAERAIFSDATKKNIENLIYKYTQETGQQNPLVLHKQHINEPLSKELKVFLRFLAEKAIFWNAITRKTNFTGRFFNLYDVLYKEFINNPLYLGSIANSENIKKLHFQFTFFEEEISESLVINKKIIRIKNNQLLDGRLASINFKDFYKDKNKKKWIHNQTKSTDSNATNFIDDDSIFLERGEQFELLKKALEKILIFFPSGVVGKHAFFTLLENEIRNVKHYVGKTLEYAQREGLTINISIHNRPINSDVNSPISVKDYEIYKIGIWLKHPSSNVDAQLIGEKFEKLAGDIITPDTFRPRLGGMFQDKICAAMLFNNTFDSVQKSDETERDRRYYPWIKSAISPVEDNGREVYDFEISQRKYQKAKNKKEYNQYYADFLSKYGGESKAIYYKKYIHLWKAEPIHYLYQDESMKWENYPRFKFLHIDKLDSRGQYLQLRKDGFIRILEENIPNNDLLTAYQKWLEKWRKNKEAVVFEVKVNNTDVCRFVYKDGDLSFKNATEIKEETDEEWEVYNAIEYKNPLTVAHGGGITTNPNLCNFRSTGILLLYFFDGIQDIAELANAKINSLNAYELFETLITKIAVIDERVYRRIPCSKLDFYRDKLQFEFYDEQFEEWEKNMKHKDLTQYHFLVIHLSFIEKMKRLDSPATYGEGEIVEFIQERILKDKTPTEVPDNFVLVIITGRGRIEWWDRLRDSEYDRFVTFRPIESLLAAVEDALLLNDDFNLKYYASKVLFGS